MLNLIIAALIIAGSVLLDQWTKVLAVEYLKGQAARPLIPGIINLTYTENTGAAFGMMKGYRWFFITLSCAAIAAMVVYLIWKRNKLNPMLAVSLSMIIGGGIGNQIDRFANGYVVDFLDFAFMKFAVFNVADSFVTVGAALLILYILIFERDSFSDKPVKNKFGEPMPAPGTGIEESPATTVNGKCQSPDVARTAESGNSDSSSSEPECEKSQTDKKTVSEDGKPESGAPEKK